MGDLHMAEDQAAGTHKKQRKPRIILILLIMICITASGASIFFFIKYREASSTEEAAKQQLVGQISQTIQLPDETPAVVTVADKTKLTNKALAARLENNDKLLIFGNAKRLVIYRPSTKKVIDMLSFQNGTDVPAGQSKK